MKTLMLAAMTAFCLPAAAAMAQDAAAALEVTDAFARSSNPKSGGAFMTIANNSEQECTLIGATSPAAGKVELHTSRENAEGMMEMLPIEGGIAIPAHGSHALARGGDHIMLMGVPTPLKQGDEVAMQLDFGDCGKVDLVVPLDNERTGTASGEAEHGEMKMEEGDAHKAH